MDINGISKVPILSDFHDVSREKIPLHCVEHAKNSWRVLYIEKLNIFGPISTELGTKHPWLKGTCVNFFQIKDHIILKE